MKKKAKKKTRKGKKYPRQKVASYLVEIVLTCCKCKRKFVITTNKYTVDERYTKEVRKKWCCKLGKCNKNEN